MSSRVDLAFLEGPHPDFPGTDLRLIRLAAEVSAWNGSVWLQADPAWVDTGAPLTVLPKSLWQGLPLERIASDISLSIGGQNMVVDVAKVWIAVSDLTHGLSMQLSVRAYLSRSDELPVVLGWEDLLTRCVLRCDHAAKIAFLEFP